MMDLDKRYDDFGRWYRSPTSGRWIPSITTVLKVLSEQAIERWRKKVGQEEAEKISVHACLRGTKMHDTMESHVLEDEYEVESGSENEMLVNQIRPLIDRNVTRVHAVEKELWIDDLGIAGRMDLGADWLYVPSILDFKSAKKPKREEWIVAHYLQTVFYSVALWQRERIKTTQVVVIIANDLKDPQVFIKNDPALLRTYYENLKWVKKRFDAKLPLDHFSRKRIAA